VEVVVVGVVDDADVVMDEEVLPCSELVELEPKRLVVEAVVELLFALVDANFGDTCKTFSEPEPAAATV
jgi:hypothetical protein